MNEEEMKDVKLSGTKVPVNFVYENEEGEEEEFSIQLDSQVFYLLCQEAMLKGVRVEDYIIESLSELLNE